MAERLERTHRYHQRRITWREYALAALGVPILASCGIIGVGTAIFASNRQTRETLLGITDEDLVKYGLIPPPTSSQLPNPHLDIFTPTASRTPTSTQTETPTKTTTPTPTITISPTWPPTWTLTPTNTETEMPSPQPTSTSTSSHEPDSRSTSSRYPWTTPGPNGSTIVCEENPGDAFGPNWKEGKVPVYDPNGNLIRYDNYQLVDPSSVGCAEGTSEAWQISPLVNP